MALGDFFAAFNPMDVVTGYERGTKLGLEREQGEEETRRRRLANQLTEIDVLPRAQLRAADTAAQMKALAENPDVLAGTYSAKMRTEAGQAKRAEAEEDFFGEGLKGRLEQRRQLAEEGLSPEATQQLLEQQEAARRGGAAGARSGATTQEAQLADQRSRGEALTLYQKQEDAERIALQKDPNAPRTDRWHKINASINDTQDANTRRLLKIELDAEALAGITRAAVAGNIPAMELYLQRYGHGNTKIELIDIVDPASGQPVKGWRLYTLQEDANRVVTKIPGQQFSARAGSDDFIGRLLPGMLGIGQVQLGPARAQPQFRQGTVQAPGTAAGAPTQTQVDPAGKQKESTNVLAGTARQSEVGAARNQPTGQPTGQGTALTPTEQQAFETGMTVGGSGAELVREEQAATAAAERAALEEKRAALNRSFEALSREEQIAVGQAQFHTKRLMDTIAGGADSEANRALLDFYSRRVEEILGRGVQRRPGPGEARGVVQQRPA